MRRSLLSVLVFLILSSSKAQDETGTTFSGQPGADPGLCATNASNFMTEQDVDRLITDMLDRINIRNRYLIVSCTKVENCQATLYKGKPYILYNPEFLQEVKRLNFSTADIRVSARNWEALVVLAHELGHHVNNHLLNPHPDATQRDMELEADEFAGSMIYWMGGSRDEAMSGYRALPEAGSYTHPGRSQRLAAVSRGWDKVRSRTPDPKQGPVNPIPTPTKVTTIASVTIGGQVWMSENLNVDRFRNGDPIPEARTAEEWERAGLNRQPAWCHYDNAPANGSTYGKLYNWYAVTDPRGLSPKGWHLPTDAEWTRLTERMGGLTKAGRDLKASVGFAGRPTGYRVPDGSFHQLGAEGFWWTSTANDSGKAWYRYLNFKSDELVRYFYNMDGGCSVRCVRD